MPEIELRLAEGPRVVEQLDREPDLAAEELRGSDVHRPGLLERADAVDRVDSGRAAAAFLLRPTRIEDVWEVAGRGDVMPQKSTFFYPKLTSGLLLHPLD